jgi:hypothetical protein
MSGWLRKLDTILLTVIAVIAIGVAVVHFYHFADPEKMDRAAPGLLTLFFWRLLRFT